MNIYFSFIIYKDGEIQDGEWLSREELLSRLEGDGRKKFVPDGLLVWDDLPYILTTHHQSLS